MNCLMITSNDATEWETHKWSTEASDLGLRGDRWPSRISTTLGNLEPLVLNWADRETAIYNQCNSLIEVTIFND